MSHEIVLMRVERAEPLILLAYVLGAAGEADVEREWAERWHALHPVGRT